MFVLCSCDGVFQSVVGPELFQSWTLDPCQGLFVVTLQQCVSSVSTCVRGFVSTCFGAVCAVWVCDGLSQPVLDPQLLKSGLWSSVGCVGVRWCVSTRFGTTTVEE